VSCASVGDEIEHVVGNTVRPGRDRQADDAGKLERLPIQPFELGVSIVGVGVALKVGDKLLGSVALW
jgi:hypothetical protein